MLFFLSPGCCTSDDGTYSCQAAAVLLSVLILLLPMLQDPDRLLAAFRSVLAAHGRRIKLVVVRHAADTAGIGNSAHTLLHCHPDVDVACGTLVLSGASVLLLLAAQVDHVVSFPPVLMPVRQICHLCRYCNNQQ
jgi:hypothetical protein